MSSAKTVSVTLSPELFRRAEDYAQREQRTISEIFSQALHNYLSRDAEWEAVLAHTRSIGREMGIHSEEDVERLSDEFRRERLR